jgi:hypothetical protein
MKRLVVIAAVGLLALTCASGASAAFRYHPDYPGVGPVLSGNQTQVRQAVRVCRTHPASCYRAVTPRAAFKRSCRQGEITPRKLAFLLAEMRNGAAFIGVGRGWLCVPVSPEEIVF